MSKKKILVVEDEALQASAITTELTNGHELIIAKNGRDGLVKALAEHPDLIILDLVMPRMDGFEMFKKLREDKWGAGANVIVLTHLSERGDEFEGQGIVEYIEKSDISLEDLAKKIEEKLK